MIYNIFYDKSIVFPSTYGGFKPDNFNQHKFYRVRLNVNPKNEDISLQQTYSYPPISFCATNGRANVKNTSVFYCSNNFSCAILESKPQIGDEGFLSVWKAKTTRDIVSGILLNNNLPRSNEWNQLANNSHQESKKSFMKNCPEAYDYLALMYDFIADIFIKEKAPYSISSMISWELLYGQLKRDFILYPSVAGKENYCNMAFHPNVVSDCLQLEKVYRFKVISKSKGDIGFKVGTEVGIYSNSRIVWRLRQDKDNDMIQRK